MERVLCVTTSSPDETRIVGASLAPTLVPGDVISLTGDLGAGKTTFVQGLATALGADRPVTSPSFTIVHEYEARYPLIHMDVYRLNSFQEVLDLGFEEFLDPNAVLLIEWGEAIAPLLPRRYLEIDLTTLNDSDEDHRRLVFRPRGKEWIRKVRAMRDTAEALLGALATEETHGPRFVVTDDPDARAG